MIDSHILDKIDFSNVIFVCIGTDRNIGDSFGPMVGSLLSLKYPDITYGTLHDPIHALNVSDRWKEISNKHRDKTVIAIDAAIGSSVGSLKVRASGVSPGKGVGKHLPKVGQYSIVAMVSDSQSVLFDTIRLSFIVDLTMELYKVLDSHLQEVSK